MFKKLTEEDFAVLRGPLESGRQSPSAMAGILVLGIFLQALMFFLAYVIGGDDSNFPFKQEMMAVHAVITSLLVICSIVFSIPNIWIRFQKSQYFVSILVSQNLFGVLSYIMALLFIGKEHSITPERMLMLTGVSLFCGLLIFTFTYLRFYILLTKGEYRKGSKKDEWRDKLETKSYVPMAIIGGIGIVYIVQYVARNTYIIDIKSIGIIIIGHFLLYAMLFVLPEQLVILYCKCRFNSFNYDKNGNLKPLGNDRKDA